MAFSISLGKSHSNFRNSTFDTRKSFVLAASLLDGLLSFTRSFTSFAASALTPLKGFFEYDHYTALFESLSDHVRPVLSFGYYTGCRRGEVLGLRWDQVDLIRGMVRLEPGETKNEESREIPLIGDLLALLRLRREERDSRFLIALGSSFTTTANRFDPSERHGRTPASAPDCGTKRQ